MSLTENFDRLKEIKPAGIKDDEAEKDIERYLIAGQRRRLTYVMRDGKQYFFFYDELRGCSEYDPETDAITLKLFDKTITIKGRNLASLFDDIGNQMISKIVTMDERYLATVEEGQVCVTQISINLENNLK